MKMRTHNKGSERTIRAKACRGLTWHWAAGVDLDEILQSKTPRFLDTNGNELAAEGYIFGSTFRAYFAWLMFTSMLGKIEEAHSNFKSARAFYASMLASYKEYTDEELIDDLKASVTAWTKEFPLAVGSSRKRWSSGGSEEVPAVTPVAAIAAARAAKAAKRASTGGDGAAAT